MPTRSMASILGLLGVCAWLGACGAEEPATQLVVVVDSDLPVTDRLDEVRVSVTGPSGVTVTVSEPLTAGGPELPLTLGVSPAGTSLGPVSITADGLRAGALVVTRSARTELVRGETRTLYLFLAAACVGATCPEGDTCTENGCMPVDVDPEDLPRWTGSPPMRDAGPADASAADAAVPTDAGPIGCASAAECDDGIECTRDLCDEGVCTNAPDDAACTLAADGHCDPTDGCQYPMCTPETCTAGPCRTAACEGDRCVRTSLCGATEACCAEACVAPGCDDGNPCTDDACGTGGCEHSDNTAACDDGLFCNGADTCGGGTCSVHAGEPCSGAAVCDEGADACTDCLTDDDCSAPTVGSWSACGGYADSCDESGTRTRTVTSYACMAGSCVGTPTTETDGCGRVTDGNTCGATTCGSYGTCGGFSSQCDESGSRSRTCTDRVCGGGTCMDSGRMETGGCSRNTDGSTCQNWATCRTGSCSGGTCSTSGSCSGFCCEPGICVPSGSECP